MTFTFDTFMIIVVAVIVGAIVYKLVVEPLMKG